MIRIDPSAKVTESVLSDGVKVFRNAVVLASRLGTGVTVGDDTNVERCRVGKHVAVNRRSYINDSEIGDYSYFGINTTMNFTRIGRFCSIARNVDLGGFDHDYHKVTTMPRFRLRQLLTGEKPKAGKHELCEIGNDVWIAAGAQVLHKVKIGDGAIVGGGAVVTKDVPPYAIVAGVPAKILGYRFPKSTIKALLKLKWWSWSDSKLRKNADLLLDYDVDKNILKKLSSVR